MSNFLLSLIPNIITFIAIGIEFIAKVFLGISLILLNISVTIHKLFKTQLGISLLKIEESTNSIVKMYTNIAKQVADGNSAQTKESNKLAEAAKGTNVVQLGKKKDDST